MFWVPFVPHKLHEKALVSLAQEVENVTAYYAQSRVLCLGADLDRAYTVIKAVQILHPINLFTVMVLDVP